jgi:hypothetical protein
VYAACAGAFPEQSGLHRPRDFADLETMKALHALKCLPAGLAIVEAVAATRGLPLAVPVVAGAPTYGGLYLVLCAVSLADIAEVRTLLPGRRAASEALV